MTEEYKQIDKAWSDLIWISIMGFLSPGGSVEPMLPHLITYFQCKGEEKEANRKKFPISKTQNPKELQLLNFKKIRLKFQI